MMANTRLGLIWYRSANRLTTGRYFSACLWARFGTMAILTKCAVFDAPSCSIVLVSDRFSSNQSANDSASAGVRTGLTVWFTTIPRWMGSLSLVYVIALSVYTV